MRPKPPNRASYWLIRLVVYGSIYLVFSMIAFFGGCADRLILFPQTGPAKPLGVRSHAIAFEQGALQIWIADPPENQPPKAYVLTFNGNADRAENAVISESYFWNAHPVEVWAVNYPGYGDSTPPAKLARLGPAGLAAYDALRLHAGDQPIIVSGTSLGTAVALHIAANRDVNGLLLLNPPPLKQMILGRFGWWNLWLIAGPVALAIPSDLDSIPNARQANAPALFTLSTQDSVVPYAWQQKVYAAYAGPKQALAIEADHNDPLTPEGERALRNHIAWLYEQAIRSR